MIRFFSIGALVLLIFFLVVQVFIFSGQQGELSKDLSVVQAKLEKAENTREDLKAQLIGYDKPENIEKKVREDFNYRRPDEKMLIIIPPRDITSSSLR